MVKPKNGAVTEWEGVPDSKKSTMFRLRMLILFSFLLFFQKQAKFLYDHDLQKLQRTGDRIMWVKVFKNGPSKICERQPLKNLTKSLKNF